MGYGRNLSCHQEVGRGTLPSHVLSGSDLHIGHCAHQTVHRLISHASNGGDRAPHSICLIASSELEIAEPAKRWGCTGCPVQSSPSPNGSPRSRGSKMNPHRLARAVGTAHRHTIEASGAVRSFRTVALAASKDEANGVLRCVRPTREHGQPPLQVASLTLQAGRPAG